MNRTVLEERLRKVEALERRGATEHERAAARSIAAKLRAELAALPRPRGYGYAPTPRVPTVAEVLVDSAFHQWARANGYEIDPVRAPQFEQVVEAPDAGPGVLWGRGFRRGF